LLNKYGTIDEIFSRLSEIKADKLRGDLWASQEQVHRARELVRLRDMMENGPELESAGAAQCGSFLLAIALWPVGIQEYAG
jgi:hypothetical protein